MESFRHLFYPGTLPRPYNYKLSSFLRKGDKNGPVVVPGGNMFNAG